MIFILSPQAEKDPRPHNPDHMAWSQLDFSAEEKPGAWSHTMQLIACSLGQRSGKLGGRCDKPAGMDADNAGH